MAAGARILRTAASVPMADQSDSFVGDPFYAAGLVATGRNKIHRRLCAEWRARTTVDDRLVSVSQQPHAFAVGSRRSGDLCFSAENHHSYLGPLGRHKNFEKDPAGSSTQSVRPCCPTAFASHSRTAIRRCGFRTA